MKSVRLEHVVAKGEIRRERKGERRRERERKEREGEEEGGREGGGRHLLRLRNLIGESG